MHKIPAYANFILTSHHTPKEKILRMIETWEHVTWELYFYNSDNKELIIEERFYRISIHWMMRKLFPLAYYDRKRTLERCKLAYHNQSIMNYYSRTLIVSN